MTAPALDQLPHAVAHAHDAIATAARVAEAIPPAIDAPSLAWAAWIILLPAISTILCGLCAAFRVRGRLPAVITVALLGASAVLTCVLYAKAPPEPVRVHVLDWINVDWWGVAGAGGLHSFVANFALYVDSLTLLWMLFVTTLGTLIALYASEYMAPDLPSAGGRGYARFFAGVSIFLMAMSCLVMGDNLIMLYLGWEGVGFASYMLIGYYYRKPSAVAAAKKAFIMNRVGDLGLALAIYLTWLNFRTVEYDGLWRALAAWPEHAAAVNGGIGWSVQVIPFLLMLAAFGKSAQIPLYTWLPDAMEGPTPVSALIHAATMVTAGVYLIARTYPLFLLHEAALPTVAWIGGLTALLAATIGTAQYDIKRVMAYSTISQLGYMFMGLGVLTTYGACFHVLTHAFFKAVLFLTCGAIMHGFAGQLDLRRLSGLRRLPGWRITSYAMLVGCLCLAGIPFSSGFFSKDAIIAEAFVSHGPGFRVLGWIGLITAAFTAYYAFRVWFRVCAGPLHYEPGEEFHGHDAAGDGGHDAHAAPTAHAAGAAAADHGHDAHDSGGFHPHAPGWAINFVLVVIAVGALVVAYFPGGGWVSDMVAGSSAAAGLPSSPLLHPDSHATLFGYDVHHALYVVSGLCGAVGLAIAWWLHLARRKAADTLRARLLGNPATRWLPTAVENKWYVDELYNAVFTMPLWLLGHLLAFIDRYLVDGLVVDGIGRLPRVAGRLFQPLQNGFLQGYAVTMAGGVALIVAWVVWVWLIGGGS